MKNKVLRTIKKYSLISPGDSIVAAVSGGPDSVAMLHVIFNLARDWNVGIHIAHLNHMFRGEEAREEASFVAGLAETYGLNCMVRSFDVPAYIKETGLSPEEAARKIRYSFLQKVAKDTGAEAIMTAHHAHDQAETVLLHILRGSGTEGLAAISPKEGNLIRPLLEVTKEEVLDYCQKHNLEYRIDPSNNQPYYLRNRIRLNLIPVLQEYNPRIVEALIRTADICRAENQFLDKITRDIILNLSYDENEHKAIANFLELKALHPALQRRVLRGIVDRITKTSGSLSFVQTEEVLSLETGQATCLPGGLKAYREYEKLIICPQKHLKINHKIEAQPVLLEVPGINYLPEYGIILRSRICSWPDPDFSPSRHKAVFSTNILDTPLLIRNRKNGDRFRPLGLKGQKKLKNFFIDEKIPKRFRDQVPLLVAGEKIIWVIGYRVADEVRVKEGEEKAVQIEVEKLSGA
jgi:tRNA(Ile)-lysidine synthase